MTRDPKDNQLTSFHPPMMAKMTMPANMDVAQLVKATMRASRVQLLLIGLYEEYAISPPNAKPVSMVSNRAGWIQT